MKELLNLIGVVPAMNIGFTESDDIDLDGLQRHTDYAIRSGVAGILIPVVASEVTALAPDERERIVAASVEAADGRVPVIGGASAATVEACVGYVRALTAAGCEGVLANIPYEDDAQYTEWVRAIDAQAPGFLMIQDYNLDGQGVPAELLARLFEEVPSYRCLKIETNLPGPKFTRMIELTGNRLNVSGGWSVSQYIEGLDRGVHCMIPTAMHEVYCTVDRLYREGRRADACALYQRLQPVIAFSNQAPGISLYFYKRMMWRLGYYRTPAVRLRLVDFDRYYQRIADDMIDLYMEVAQSVRDGDYD